MENINSTSNYDAPPPSSNTEHQFDNAPLEQILSAPEPAPTSSTSGTSSNDAPASISLTEPSTSPASQPSTTQQTPPASQQTQGALGTTLWENFMASFRNVIHRDSASSARNAQSASSANSADSTYRQNTHASAPTASDPSDASRTASTAAQDSSSSVPSQHPTGLSTGSSTEAPGTLRPPVFFRLPFSGPDGAPALLAFHPQPLPQQGSQSGSQPRPAAPSASASSPSSGAQPSSQPQQGAEQSNTYPTGRPNLASDGAQDQAGPRSHPHPDGHIPISPIFVPFGSSPLPFSFLYDQHTGFAWPIAQVTPGSPPGGPSPDAPESQQPRLVAGPPFRIILDIHFGAPPEPELPDPEKAANYVKQLERADAELRARMARLGMGSIGGFADATGSDDQDALLGCGVCLDNYEAEDRPEWIDGPKSQDDAVVAVPCSGHHTLHAGCFREWLVKLPPSQWTCPFCRASLSPDATRRAAQPSQSANGTTTSSRASPKAASSSSPAAHTTLREDVRARERQRGWRCDAPACFPRYPVSSRTDDGHLELPETSDGMTTDLVKLTPCRHEVHLDCLCTSMRVENDLAGADDLDAILGYSDDDSDDEQLRQNDGEGAEPCDKDREERDKVGKWVTCPTCRKECWAELPLRRKPQRLANDTSAQQTRQDALEEGSRHVIVSEKPMSSVLEVKVDADSKAENPAATQIDRGPVTAEDTSDVVVDVGDHEEEEAVDTMLLRS